MRKSLNEKNRTDIKNQCKMGLGISLMVFMLFSIIGITVYELMFDPDSTALNSQMAISIVIGVLFIAVLLSFLINHKYYSDLRNNEKVLFTKRLSGKTKSIDPVAFKGANLAKAYSNRFEFVVDNVKYRVDEQLYKSCAEGDTLLFSYALKSKYLLDIEKK
jgi:hypothetical protein